MNSLRARSGLTVVELMVAASIASFLLIAVMGMAIRGSRIGQNAQTSARTTTMNSVFKRLMTADLRAAYQAEELGNDCVLIETYTRWITYCTRDEPDAHGLFRAEQDKPAGTQANRPNARGIPGGTKIAPDGSQVHIAWNDPQYRATLIIPGPNPTMPDSTFELHVTPRVNQGA